MTRKTKTAEAARGGRWRVRPEVAHREVEGQVVLLLPGEDELFTLNDSAKLLWSRLVAGATGAELAAALASHYGLAPAAAAADADALVRELARRRIVARR